MNLLNIIIPIHNRQYLLERVFQHYKEICDDASIALVARDSSEKPFQKAEGFPWVDYEWVGPEKNYDKCLDFLKNNKSKYILLAADDDFYLKSSILKGINFLETNSSYSSVHGQYVIFCSKVAKIIRKAYKLQYYNGIKDNFTSLDAKDRLLNFMNVERYTMLNHSLVRYDAFMLGHRLVHENEFLRCRFFSDFIHAFGFLMTGDIKTLPILWGMRDADRMLNKNLVPKEAKLEITMNDLPSTLIKHGNPLSTLLSKTSDISKENAALILGQCLGMNLYGRFHTNEVHRKGAEITDFTFPSETEEFREEINSVLQLVKKYSDQLPQD